jgi:hypothetical protein
MRQGGTKRFQRGKRDKESFLKRERGRNRVGRKEGKAGLV